MRLVLDGISAFEYWQCAAFSNNKEAVKVPHAQLSSFTHTSCGEISKSISNQDGYSGPLHILLESASDRRNTKHLACGVWGNRAVLPPNSLYRIGSGLYVESPEFCLVRLAALLPKLEFYRSLSDILGIYTLSYTDRIQIIQRDPITSIKKIQEFIDLMPGARGAKSLRNALRWIVPRAASPRETSMDLTLAMPSRSGGQGIPRFEANYHVPLTSNASLLTTKKYLVADAMWPEENVSLEYNSSKYHDTEEQLRFDFEKITAMESMGKTVLPLSVRQFNSYESYHALVQTLRRRLRVRTTISKETEQRRKRVHEELLQIERRDRELPCLADTARWQYLLPRIGL